MITIDEAMQRASDAIDEIGDVALADARATLTRLGATDEELDREMAFQTKEFATWRAENLASLRSWLARDGEALN